MSFKRPSSPKPSKKTAFVLGFWRGLTAPVSIYSTLQFPAEAQPLEFLPIKKRETPSESDWVKVGEQLRAAIEIQRNELGLPQVRNKSAHLPRG